MSVFIRIYIAAIFDVHGSLTYNPEKGRYRIEIHTSEAVIQQRITENLKGRIAGEGKVSYWYATGEEALAAANAIVPYTIVTSLYLQTWLNGMKLVGHIEHRDERDKYAARLKELRPASRGGNGHTARRKRDGKR